MTADPILSREPATGDKDRVDEWQRLRALLLAGERASIDSLAARVGDPDRLARSVAAVLPVALRLRARQDDRITRAMAPIVQNALLHTVKTAPQPLVDALYPIMGPAIRRSIGEALADMLQAFNQAVALSFSPRALKWRFDAWRTGQSYASIVLLNTLVYRVEQVFLIHRASGLLLGHTQAEDAVVQDPDMVSGMLTAIRDFVGDSFQVDRDQGVESIGVGDLKVLVQVGPAAVLAAVVRGSAPESLRVQLAETLEGIHQSHASALSRFSGDAAPFSEAGEALRRCLWTPTRTPSKHSSRPAYIMLCAVIALCAWSGAAHYQASVAWRSLVEALEHEPGLVLLDTGRSGDHRIVGLRDPLARDPKLVVGAELMRKSHVTWQWKPYLSLDPAILLERVRNGLQPPQTVALRLEGSVLKASGVADASWLAEARRRVSFIAGLQSADFSAVALQADTKLTQARDVLNAIVLYFEPGSDSLSAPQSAKLEAARAKFAAFRDSADELHMFYRVDLVGRADTPGTTVFNQHLSESRAEAVRRVLVQQGTPVQMIRVRGIGATASELDAPREQSPASAADRRVNVKVVIGAAEPLPDSEP